MPGPRIAARRSPSSVGPPVGNRLAVALGRAVAAGDDQLEPLVPGLEGPGHLGGDADQVPAPHVADLVVELDPPGAADDDVDLLLDAMGVSHRGAETGAVAEVADAEVLGAQVLSAEARL